MPKQYVTISYQVEDKEGNITTMPIKHKVGEVTTKAIAQTIATELSELFAAVSKCTIIGAEVTFPLTVFDDTAGAEDDYTNDRGATLSLRSTAEVGDSLYVPGWDLSKISNKNVDTGAGDVMNFINALTSGAGITGGYKAVDSSGNYLETYVRGRQTTRK